MSLRRAAIRLTWVAAAACPVACSALFPYDPGHGGGLDGPLPDAGDSDSVPAADQDASRPRLPHALYAVDAGTRDRLFERRYAPGKGWSDEQPVDALAAGQRAGTIYYPSPPPSAEVSLAAVAVEGDGGQRSLLLLSREPGGAWRRPATVTGELEPAAQEPAGLAYEQTSGEAMVVYAELRGPGGNCAIRYRTIDRQGEMSDSLRVLELDQGKCTPPVSELRLVANPRNDQLALALSDAEARLFLLIWSGEFWHDFATASTLTPGHERLQTTGSWSLAHEHQSGRLLLAWAFRALFDPVNSGLKHITVPVPAAGEPPSWDEPTSEALPDTDWLLLAPEPGTDRIAGIGLLITGAGPTYRGLYWADGDLQVRERIATFDCFWCNSAAGGLGWAGERAIAVVGPSSGDTSENLLHAVACSDGTWTELAAHRVARLGDAASVAVIGPVEAYDRRAMALLASSTGQLFSASSDGDSWKTEWAAAGPLVDGNLASLLAYALSLQLEPSR